MFLAPWLWLLQRLDTLATLCGDELFLTTPSLARFFRFLWRTGPSPSYPLWTVSTSLPRSQPSIGLLPVQDEKEGEFFMQRLRTPSAGSDSPPPWLSRIWASPACHLRHYFHFWPLVQTLGCGPTVGLHGVPPRPHHSSEGSGSTTTSTYTNRRLRNQKYCLWPLVLNISNTFHWIYIYSEFPCPFSV